MMRTQSSISILQDKINFVIGTSSLLENDSNVKEVSHG